MEIRIKNAIYKIKVILRKSKITGKIYYRLYKLKSSKKSKLLQELYINVTQAIYDGFEKNELEYAYEFGSLLGLIRDKKFMEHDDDIDLMYFPHNEEELLQLPKLLLPYGFILDHYYTVDGKIVEYTFDYCSSGLTVDVFVKSNVDGMSTSYWLYQDKDVKYENMNEMSVSYDKMANVDFFKYLNFWGVDLRIPNNAEEILYWHYGPKWMIKDPNYSPKNSPGFKETNMKGYKVNVSK